MILFFENKHYPNVKTGPGFQNQFPFQHTHGVAFHNQNTLFASGVNHGGGVHFAPYTNPTLAALKDWVEKSFGDPQPTESPYVPGTVYKRMFRPLASTGSFDRAIAQDKFTESFVALRILLNKLEELFETVEPTTANLPAYGHKIREILLLGCMEVESSWAAVLKDNGYASAGHFTTNDYVKLLEPMLLDSYELSLQSYPLVPPFTPFANWDRSNPTQSLGWYDAYNKTKHDREANLHLGSLENAIHSVGAAVVLFYAQFGFRFGPTGGDRKGPIISNIFRAISHFDKYPNACYIPSYEVLPNASPTPTPSFDWQVVNYPF